MNLRKIDNMNDAINHILWTIEKSPKTYEMYEIRLNELKNAISRSEVRGEKHDNTN